MAMCGVENNLSHLMPMCSVEFEQVSLPSCFSSHTMNK